MVNAGIRAPQDFENIPLTDWGQTIKRTPVTKTTNFYGDEVLTDGTPESFTGIFFEVPKNSDTWKKYGLVRGADGIIYAKQDQTLNKNDEIIVGGKRYRLDVVTTRKPGGVAMYKVAPVFYIDLASEVFTMTFPLTLS